MSDPPLDLSTPSDAEILLVRLLSADLEKLASALSLPNDMPITEFIVGCVSRLDNAARRYAWLTRVAPEQIAAIAYRMPEAREFSHDDVDACVDAAMKHEGE